MWMSSTIPGIKPTTISLSRPQIIYNILSDLVSQLDFFHFRKLETVTLLERYDQSTFQGELDFAGDALTATERLIIQRQWLKEGEK